MSPNLRPFFFQIEYPTYNFSALTDDIPYFEKSYLDIQLFQFFLLETVNKSPLFIT